MSWPGQLLEVMLISVAWAVIMVSMVLSSAEDFVDVCGLYCTVSVLTLEAYGCPRLMPSPETMWKLMICAPACCKGQGSVFCSGIDDFRLKIENERCCKLLSHTHPQNSKKNKEIVQTGSHLREPIKIVIKMLKYSY